jgi:hypothetical protein
LLNSLQQSAVTAPAQPADTQPEPEPAVAPVDLTSEALATFTTRVQPILMNACASCHASGRAGAFKLTRTYNDPQPNRKATQQNLTAVLAQINLERPQASPLLTRSVSQHGDMTQPPLKNRQAVAYRSLEEWVQRTLADNPQLQAAAPTSVAAAAEPKHERSAEPVPARSVPLEPANLPPPPSIGAPAPAAPASVSVPAVPAVRPATPQPAAPESEFDADIFNRQWHPQGKDPGAVTPAPQPPVGSTQQPGP